ncbi:hypothetical protein FRB94_009514 [Tulasnella sp. JGI-2019a]|nr:hypothetical protein FRB94_009514 [Tulasnella sp. JGI-2019a]KAG9007943.1 hypothetical protein FRB93_006962 [Tulasnella sp. JGI-2019a]KAG9025442.1 hypothetical protein FRB95_010125 [Tulasnella sp. JGI-2019a]
MSRLSLNFLCGSLTELYDWHALLSVNSAPAHRTGVTTLGRQPHGIIQEILTAQLTNTSGGGGGPTVTVTIVTALTSAVAGNITTIADISGTITGGKVGAPLVGIGLRVLNQTNVIIRNIKISKVLAATSDAIGIQASSKVWVDHKDLSSDRDHDKGIGSLCPQTHMNLTETNDLRRLL